MRSSTPPNRRAAMSKTSAFAAFATLIVLTSACSLFGDDEDGPPRELSYKTRDGVPVTEWEVGPSGGSLSSRDGSIRIQVPAGAADPGTHVQLTQRASPSPVETHLRAVADFDITPVKGKLDRATVSVRYDGAKITSGSLMMLLEDHKGGWQVLDMTVDPRQSTVTASWEHFSRGGLFWAPPLLLPIGADPEKARDIGRWLWDRVITFKIGPKKPPDCNKKGEAGWKKDGGWAFTSTNGEGGRMIVSPLDGCAAIADTRGRHPVEVTNRYWYAFSGKLPAGASLEVGDVVAHTELTDAIIGGIEYLVDDKVLVPGHSRARFKLTGNPRGQTATFAAAADTPSIVLAAVITAVDIASLGSGRVVKAGVKGLEDALWAERAGARSALTPADIAERMGDREWVANNAEKFRPAEVSSPLYQRFFDHMELYNCVYGAFKAGYQSAETPSDAAVKQILAELWSVITKTLTDCQKELAHAYIGEAFRLADPSERNRMAQEVLKGLLDLKPVRAVEERQWAEWAKETGRDYLHARLHVRQARDPRIDVFADFDWALWLRPKSSCIPEGDEAWNVYEARVLARADVTGDTYPDYIVRGECPGATSSWPEVVYVIDGSSDERDPRLLGTFDDDYWRDAGVTVDVKRRAITLAGPVVDEGPLCCPDKRVTVRYEWRNGKFREASRRAVPLQQP